MDSEIEGRQAGMQQPPLTELMHWEDVPVGETRAFGRITVSRDEIVAFARAFDPQPVHVDEEAAKASMIGQLFASGWHSCAMMMRMLADDILNDFASLGSPGLEDCRWMKPVFPGDVLSGRYTCVAKRVLKSRPGVGICQMEYAMINQAGDIVMTWKAAQLMRVRNAGDAP
jgi:acyl dehydratase